MSLSTSFLVPLRQALDEAKCAGGELTQLLYSGDHSSNGDVNNQIHPHTLVDVSAAVREPRKRLADAAARLLQLSTDPKEHLEQLAANNQYLICIRWLVNLNVLQHIPTEGSISYLQLASRTNVPEQQLKSVARMAAVHGFLHEPSPSRISHSPSSNLLATSSKYLNWARFLVNYSVPSAFHFSEATQRWGETVKKDETAFNIAMNVKEPFFEHLRANEQLNSMFSSYMQTVANSEGMSFEHLINGFDWGSLENGAKVVDIGGSGGHASAALASAFPELNFIVQDLPETIANAKASQGAVASRHGINGRNQLTFMSHDLFTPQPVVDADIYLLRMIIHDWPDEAAIDILSHIKLAMKKPGARILVMDTILPQPGTVSLLQERQLRVRDLTMMQVFNAKEREYEAWEGLFERVGLKVVSTRQTDGSNMGILEVGHEDEYPMEASSSGSLTPMTNRDSSTTSLENIPTTNIKQAISMIDLREDSTLTTLESASKPNGVHTVPIIAPPIGSDDLLTRPDIIGPKPSVSSLPVLIIGAGISGLCLAQYLQKNSIPFRVYERDPDVEYRPQGYRLKLEADAAEALRDSLSKELYQAFETSSAESFVGETDFDPISGLCIKSRAGGGLFGRQGLRASYTVDRSVFRRILMTGIEDKIHFGRGFASYKIQKGGESHVVAEFQDGSSAEGRFIVGADGSRSSLRKQHLRNHKFLDTGAVCIYGKTIMTPDLLQRYPSRGLRWMTVCADTAPLIQSILIGESPLTLLSEPIRFSDRSRADSIVTIPDDYVYWVLIGRREIFTDSENTGESNSAISKPYDSSANTSAELSLRLTEEWHPSLRSLFELQDVRQSSTMRVISAPPKIPEWEPSACVTLIGDAVHAMSPCGGVGANTALRDAVELGKVLVGSTGDGELAHRVGIFEAELRKRAFAGLMRSYVGSKRMFNQRPFEDLAIVED